MTRDDCNRLTEAVSRLWWLRPVEMAALVDALNTEFPEWRFFVDGNRMKPNMIRKAGLVLGSSEPNGRVWMGVRRATQQA